MGGQYGHWGDRVSGRRDRDHSSDWKSQGQWIIIFQVLLEAWHIDSEFTLFAQHHQPSEQR